MALAELHGIATERQHWRKARAASELHTSGILSTDLSPVLELLNQARKDAGYEGETPDFGDWTSGDLLSTVEDAVHTAEEAVHTAENETDTAEEAVQNTQGSAETEEESIP